jgi:hypothetical protein
MNTAVVGCVGALVLDPQDVDTCAPITRIVTARTSAMSGAVTSERRDGWIVLVDMTPPSPGGNLVRSVQTDGMEREGRRNRPYEYV